MTPMLPPAETPPPAEMTLDELRRALAAILPVHAAFDGWSVAALGEAAADLGISADRARLAFPDGAVGMIDAWFAWIDDAMAAALPPERLAQMRIRAKITALVTARLEAAAPHREALRRALATLAMPPNLAHGARLGWRAADAMWRLAGDTATDLAHYTKRLTLAGVYGATLLVFVDDDEEDGAQDFAATRAFLARRIEGIMRFEQLKARLKPAPDRQFSPVRFLGRLRYPAR